MAVSLVAWGGTYWLVQREMLQAVDDRLRVRMAAAIATLEAGSPLPTPGLGQTVTILSSDDAGQTEGFHFRDHRSSDMDLRVLIKQTDAGLIQLGEDIERQEEMLEILMAGMQLSLLASLAAAGLAATWLARRGQQRLDTISEGLAEVARGQLGRRITLDGQDDLSLLAQRINATTERLDQAVTQMRVQSSNIAHDLRTPLARLRAQTETLLVALATERRAVTVDDLESAMAQIDRITGTFDALLRLARIESGAGREGFRPISVAELLGDVAETFGPVVEDAGQTLTVELTEPAKINGDRDMLIQLLANLLQNAIRYGAQGQTITLRSHGPHISVSDQGSGVPVGDRQRVLQPLYQRESTRQGEGFGLGLSLVRAIADLHDADLSLSDGPGGRGLAVTVRFPNLTQV